jgi:hypothetical protein
VIALTTVEIRQKDPADRQPVAFYANTNPALAFVGCLAQYLYQGAIGKRHHDVTASRQLDTPVRPKLLRLRSSKEEK